MAYTPVVYRNTNDHGRNHWYDECSCCPYGYHIDLDFVRYCESVSKEADRTGSIKRRKDRRRQRQSMEVLLGITPPVLDGDSPYKTPILEQETPKIIQKQTTTTQFPMIQDSFDDAVSDFERTLQRSKNKLSNNLPDVTAVTEPIKRVPSNSSMSSASGSSSMTVLPETTNRDFDSVSIESCGLSPLALQNIREQMALSLERTKQLEDQVKLIPQLKDQLAALKQENRQLHYKLKIAQNQKLNAINANYIGQFPTNNRLKSQSFTDIDSLDGKKEKEHPPPPPPRKDFGVNCGVLTRNVGVGHQTANMKNVSTATLDDLAGDYTADKWLSEKVKFLNTRNESHSRIVKTAKHTQTVADKREIAIQTADYTKKSRLSSATTQTVETSKKLNNIAVTAVPATSDCAIQKNIECYNVGVGDDTISDVVCDNCNVLKVNTAAGPDSSEDSHTSPISLASLLGSRSKSFNLGEGVNIAAKSRTVACQHDATFGKSHKNMQAFVAGITKACQSEVKTMSKSCQHESRQTYNKNTQCDNVNQKKTNITNKMTDTKDLLSARHVACEAKVIKNATDVGVNVNVQTHETCVKCNSKEKEDLAKKDGSPTASRIPRPQIPTTPVEVRKFRRQDTYTKLYSSPTDRSPVNSTLQLSGIDLAPKPPTTAEPTSPLDKVKQTFKLRETAYPKNGISTSSSPPPTKVQVQENLLPLPETTLFSQSSSSHSRKKVVPSKEMQAAMKVLNDSLQKSHTQCKNLRNTSAINIIQQEWFKISSMVTANPLTVEDYLDALEEVSSVLLQHVVNMTDDSGNTAMHYAVSHGNFDVVSILLDSKVCDINKPNKAGYTSVMLVSLAEVRSQTHASVVRRLFQLADVNIRAKQHGQTALMLAVSHGRLDMVRMLVEAGADVNIQDEDGSTALMCAAEHGHVEIVKFFLSQPDCDSSITDVDGSNALKIAMEAGHKHVGVLLYAHERNLQMMHGKRKSKPASPKTPSSPLPIRSSHRALTDTKSSSSLNK